MCSSEQVIMFTCSPVNMFTNKFVVWFNEVDKEDITLVGGKGANLGEMTKAGIPVPPGFIVTASAYFYFLQKNNLKSKIKNALASCDVNDPRQLDHASKTIQKIILSAKIPKEISQAIIDYYFRLNQIYDDTVLYHYKQVQKKKIIDKIKNGFAQSLKKVKKFTELPLVAVRSSATAEDLPEASFAGQQETFLNIEGEANLIESVRKCWASLFEPRAIFYRQEHNFDHFKVGIAVPVQKMIQSETSGVMFTVDPLTNNKITIVIEAIFGLGELIVQGTITPDHYKINKQSLKIFEKQIAPQEKMLKLQKSRNILKTIPKKLQKNQKLTDRQITEIAIWGKKIEKHYYFPQDIEWAVENGHIYILQTRPITTINEKLKIENGKLQSKIEKELKIFLSGTGASPGIATGPVKIIQSSKELHKIKPGDVLVAEMTNPSYVPVMKKAVAIITDKGGQTSHAAIVSRELGIPCIVGAKNAVKKLKNGLVITVNGSTGKVYKGGYLNNKIISRYSNKSMNPPAGRQISNILNISHIKTATKLYLNLAEPDLSKELSQRNVDGIGLLRAEFILAKIGRHPKQFIKERTQKLFVKNLSENIKKIAHNFYPKPVVYRATDFKTNEYRDLKYGRLYEPEEPNPMLGFRGAFRYISNDDIFNLELQAIKIIRNKYNLKNLWLMIPFVHTVRELIEVKSLIYLAGLRRSSSFKIWMMVEIPSNVILLEKFIEAGIDGVSIGSNDLTMLILGVDRDNSEVASVYNEQDPAVLWCLEKVIKICHQYKITSSICGQAPSEYPELVEKLVKWGITSISVNADAIERTREIIYEAEKKLVVKL